MNAGSRSAPTGPVGPAEHDPATGSGLRDPDGPAHRAVLAVGGVITGTLWFAVSAASAHALEPTGWTLTLLLLLDAGAVLAVSRALGVVCAMPVGIAGVVAIDWHLIPPTHATVLPEPSSAVALAAYLLAGVLLGLLADGVRRRATAAERGRRLLAEEQAALRRIATLIAREADPDSVFSAVAEEVRHLLSVDVAALVHCHPDGTGTLVAWSGTPGTLTRVGSRLPGGSIISTVYDTGRTARYGSGEPSSALLAAQLGMNGALSSVACPVTVHGTVWGVLLAGAQEGTPMPAQAAAQITEVTELVTIAIANAQARTELQASRARVITRSDNARRALERDLHDGVQQRLVALALELRVTETASDPVELRAGLRQGRAELSEIIDELRELSHGLHPAILSSGGLRPAVSALARRAGLPTELHFQGTATPPQAVMVAAYYVIAESLTNIAKHADATFCTIGVEVSDSEVVLEVVDDGVGGADISAGTGLLGLVDRVEALGGRLQLSSRPDAGTTLSVGLPYSSATLPDSFVPATAARIASEIMVDRG